MYIVWLVAATIVLLAAFGVVMKGALVSGLLISLGAGIVYFIAGICYADSKEK